MIMAPAARLDDVQIGQLWRSHSGPGALPLDGEAPPYQESNRLSGGRTRSVPR